MAEYLTPGETCKLVEEELGVERSCIRSCVDENVCRVSCLVSYVITLMSWNTVIDFKNVSLRSFKLFDP